MDAEIVSENRAEQIMKEINVQQEGIDIMLPKTRFRLVLLKGIDSGTANIIKQEMLAAGGDAAVAVGTVSCKVPATDMLLMGTVKQYNKVLGKLSYNEINCPEAAGQIKGALGL